MKKYLLSSVITSLTVVAIYLLRDNYMAAMIASAVGFLSAGYQWGYSDAEEYYQTPQYVIITQEALKEAAANLDKN